MVPSYLASIADQVTEKKGVTAFHLKCLCGHGKFLLAKSENIENIKNNPFDNYWKSFKLPIFSLCKTVDENGEEYVYGTTFFGNKKGKFYTKDMPVINDRRVIKAKCCHCGKEFTVFDSKCNGYDALADEADMAEAAQNAPEIYAAQAAREAHMAEIEQEFIWTEDPAEVSVEVCEALPYDDFREDFEDDMEKYSNAFGDIDICTIINGKKKRYYNEETA